MENIELMIVILNYNTFNDTINCVNSLVNKKSNVKYKIIIVDNNSSNKSFFFLKKKFGNNNEIILVKNKKNGGYAQGNNLGIKYGLKLFNPKYVFILNNDILFIQDYSLDRLINVMNKNRNVAMISPVLKTGEFYYAETMEYNLKYFFIQKVLTIFFYKYFFKPSIISGFKKEIIGAANIYRTNVLKKINYFDENTFLYCEEAIVSEKFKKYNYKKYLLSTVIVEHKHSVSINLRYNKFKQLLHLYKSERYFFYRYKNISEIIIFIMQIINYNFNLILKYLV